MDPMKLPFSLLSLLLLSACGGKAASDEKKVEPTAQVRTEAAAVGFTGGETLVYGVTEAAPGGTHALIAPAEAILAVVNAPTGTAVRAGTVVVTLRPSPATKLVIAKAASDGALAQAAYARALRMRADGLVANADVETARAALASARATSGNLGISGGLSALRAPITGTVQGLTAKPGDQLTAGTTVATIGSAGDLRVRFGVDPAMAQRVHPGTPIQLQKIDGSPIPTATVVGVDPQVDPSTRLASVYAQLPSAAGLGAGVSIKGALQVGGAAGGVSVPYAALLDDGGRSYVFVIRNGIAKMQNVSPGNTSGDRVQILTGLSPGDRVVTEGGTALEDGMKVNELKLGRAK
jgi:RND family efflux transporter MFP subunit